MTKHTPATATPYHSYEVNNGDANRYRVGTAQHAVAHIAATGRLKDDAQQADYIAHAANAYVRLVEYVRDVIRRTPALSDATPYEMQCFKEARALLRELGEL